MEAITIVNISSCGLYMFLLANKHHFQGDRERLQDGRGRARRGARTCGSRVSGGPGRAAHSADRRISAL